MKVELLRLSEGGGDVGSHVKPVVLLAMPRSVTYVVALMAALMTDELLVCPIDPSLPPSAVSSLLQSLHQQLRLVITTSAHIPLWQRRVSSLAPSPSLLSIDTLLGAHSHARQQASLQDGRQERTDESAVLLCTSGSTGDPKLVVLSRSALLMRARWGMDRLMVDSASVYAQRTPVGFVDHVAEILTPLLAGGCVAIAPSGLHTVDVGAFWQWLADAKVTHLTVVPTLVSMALRMVDEEDVVWPRVAATLRLVVFSGEPLVWGTAIGLWERLPTVALFNLYGLTETTGDILCFPLPFPEHPLAPPHPATPVPLGWPLTSDCLTFVASEGCLPARGTDARRQAACGWVNGPPEVEQRSAAGVEVSADVTREGELVAGGPLLAVGYWGPIGGCSDETREAFVTAKVGDGETRRVLCTGDVVERDSDGCFHFKGRVDRSIKIGGVFVSLDATERQILSLQTAADVSITEARVCTMSDLQQSTIRSKPSDSSLVAFVATLPPPGELSDNQRDAVMQLIRRAASSGGGGVIDVVLVESLPRNARNMKVSMEGLADVCVKRQTTADVQGIPSATTPPSSDDFVEVVLAVCRGVTGGAAIRPDDDLREWGWDSLTLANLAFSLNRCLSDRQDGPQVSIADLLALYLPAAPQPQPHPPQPLTPRTIAERLLLPRQQQLAHHNTDTDTAQRSGAYARPVGDQNGRLPVHMNVESGATAKLEWSVYLESCVDAPCAVVTASQLSAAGVYQTPSMDRLFGCGWAVYAGSHSGVLAAISCSSGEAIWTRRLSGRIVSQPLAFTLTDAPRSPSRLGLLVSTYDGSVVCLDGLTGELWWVTQLAGHIKASPRILDGTIVAATYDGALELIDADAGALLHRFQPSGLVQQSDEGSGQPAKRRKRNTEGKSSAAVPLGGFSDAPEVDQETKRMYVATLGGWVARIDLLSTSDEGRQQVRMAQRWARQLDGPCFARPLLCRSASGGLLLVVCTGGGSVYGVAEADGELMWRTTVPLPPSTDESTAILPAIFASPVSPLLSSDGRSAAIICARDGSLHRVDVGSGAVGPCGRLQGGRLLSHNVKAVTLGEGGRLGVVACAEGGWVGVFDVVGCRSAWHVFLPSFFSGAAESTEVSEVDVYESYSGGEVVSVESAPGRPCVSRVLLGCRDNCLHCFRCT
ncbi:unnamed protein product [Vitrella brassicaformis CCMP3155]|uniref:Uncharacterized protein n=3 Tax=Vitrella brassicaformis TaxID=1169539 RepID=A0A0G4GIC6_VITBC|nr:unnamed protein product [Vitrella brassicaformis CCMP3155]|eukprot:CEM29597.1 unnamed protein product [Vitrella brassicaformis CCMP3155]